VGRERNLHEIMIRLEQDLQTNRMLSHRTKLSLLDEKPRPDNLLHYIAFNLEPGCNYKRNGNLGNLHSNKRMLTVSLVTGAGQ